jgi:hypothetical protein
MGMQFCYRQTFHMLGMCVLIVLFFFIFFALILLFCTLFCAQAPLLQPLDYHYLHYHYNLLPLIIESLDQNLLVQTLVYRPSRHQSLPPNPPSHQRVCLLYISCWFLLNGRCSSCLVCNIIMIFFFYFQLFEHMFDSFCCFRPSAQPGQYLETPGVGSPIH